MKSVLCVAAGAAALTAAIEFAEKLGAGGWPQAGVVGCVVVGVMLILLGTALGGR